MYDIAIIGAGPGGYIAAIRAVQLGLKVVLVEKGHLGGTCLNMGCIPSKAVINCAENYEQLKKLSKFGISIENPTFDYKKVAARKTDVVEKLRKSLGMLLKSNGIDVITGKATLQNSNSLIVEGEETQKVEFKNLIIATGSEPSSVPGIEINHDFTLDSNDILNLEELPESIMIVGSGAIGIEWARIFTGFGVKVTIIEIAERLSPLSDFSVSERIERIFKRSRVDYYTSTTVQSIEGKTVTLSNGKVINADKIFVAVGRRPVLDFGIENVPLEMNKKFIKVDENLKTSVDNIYAVGDVTGLLQLAHVASHQGIAVVENIALNKPAEINYKAIPTVIYGKPEIASVGYTEQELQSIGKTYKTSIFPMSALGKAFTDDEIEGFVKILASDSEILGVHIVGAEASSLIHQFAQAITLGLSPQQIEKIVYAHPTYAEAVYEALIGLENRSFSLYKNS